MPRLRRSVLKIGFVLSSNAEYPLPSTRIAVINMLPHLRGANLDVHVVFNPSTNSLRPDVSGLAEKLVANRFDVVCFQKVGGPSVVELARRLAAARITTVFMICDMIDVDMTASTDATIVVTEELRRLYPPQLQSRIHVVHDGIERPDLYKREWSEHAGSSRQPLRAVLVTWADLTRLPVLERAPPWLEISVVGRYSSSPDPLLRWKNLWWSVQGDQAVSHHLATVRFLSDSRIRRVSWNPQTVYDVMRTADIGIIPIEPSSQVAGGTQFPAWLLKSENRLTMKMAVGLPVVATPIPSYARVIEHGTNGFLARTRRDWFVQLDALRDPALRREVGGRARESVLGRYSIEEQARRFVSIIDRLSQQGGN